jgi:transcriptional regulator with XRE-family HTH domain
MGNVITEADLTDAPEGIDALVGRRIRERRRHLGISQIQLAATIGVSYQQLQKYEQGSNRVAAPRLAAISAALDVPPGYFFVTGTPDDTHSKPHAFDLTCLAAAQAASEAASELVRVTRQGTPVMLARLVAAARAVAELESRPQEAELLMVIHRWDAEHPARCSTTLDEMAPE